MKTVCTLLTLSLILLATPLMAGQMLNRNAYGVRGVDTTDRYQFLTGLEWYYDFESTTNDVSGNDRDGSIGTASYISDSQNTVISNGTFLVATNFLYSATNWTFSCWFRHPLRSLGTTMMQIRDATAGTARGFSIGTLNGANTFGPHVWSTNVVTYAYRTAIGSVPYSNIWVHATATFNGSTLVFYTNGAYASQTSAQAAYPSKEDYYPTSATRYLGVAIPLMALDNAMYWNRVLTSNDVASLYEYQSIVPHPTNP